MSESDAVTAEGLSALINSLGPDTEIWNQEKIDYFVKKAVASKRDFNDGDLENLAYEMEHVTGGAITADDFENRVNNNGDVSKQPKRNDVDVVRDKICSGIAKLLEVELSKAGDFVNETKIKDCLYGVFFAEVRNKYMLINANGDLVAFNEKDTKLFLVEIFGDFLNGTKLAGVCSDPDARKCREIALFCIMCAIRLNSQRNALEMRVDMFAKKGRIEIKPYKARIVYAHKPLISNLSKYDKKIVEDFKSHFPKLDEFLEMIIAAKFSRDRKKAFLWMKCDSDWGKGFLISALKDLGLIVSMTEKEVEGIFEGRPAGKSMHDFVAAMVVSFDEFKSVKSEMKHLQNTMAISAKHQLEVDVEIFAKVFWSAESVASLVGEQGVEDQFANRFSYWSLTGNLDKRPVFVNTGKGVYLDNVKAYLCAVLNGHVDLYKGKGRILAEQEADKYLNAFQKKNGIDQHFDRVSSNIEGMASDVLAWLKTRYNKNTEKITENIHNYKGQTFLTKPAKVFALWVEDSFGYSERVTISKKRQEIINAISADGKGVANHRMPDQQKSLLLKEYFDQ